LGWQLKTNADRLRAMPIYALTIFTGAFLLFLVQPLIGKYILPWFGGAPAVWTTCMLFFQLLLLAGYAYAHFSARWLKPRAQAIVHLILLIAAMALLNHITPSNSWKPTDGANPTLRILGLLLASIGLPYFVLASTSPLMQHWFSRTNPGVSPFRLYALSNVGSMLALISFPIYFETHFTRPLQSHLWGAGLVLFAISCGCCAWKLWRMPATKIPAPVKTKTNADGTPSPTLAQKLLWLLLPACASTLLLATTNMICQEVAVIPFLWVLPLALYLLSFIICFDSPRWYVRLPFAVTLVAALGGICWIVFQGTAASMYLQLSIYLAGLFICCMVCHGELYRLRPDPRHLTGFYLMIAAGGALGGLFVAIMAPLIFTDYYELHWGLFCCGLLFLTVCLRERNLVRPKKKDGGRAGFSQQQRTAGCVVLAIGLAALGVALWMQAHTQLNLTANTDPTQKGHPFAKTLVERSRNFYGVLAVYKHDDVDLNTHLMEFTHGRTLHGMQFTDPLRALWPTAYFSELSGIGMAMRALPAGGQRIGVVGLGAGTLAAYPHAGDYLHIYEINPEVLRLASTWFTYLTNCKAKMEITLGDARLSLETEPPQNFDLLVLDAFNSDAPPVHLLTKEAFTIYERHLKTNGMIAVNVSNKRINLDPVIANLARQFNYHMVIVDNPSPRDKPWIMSASWALLSRSKNGDKIINSPAVQLSSRPPLTNNVNIPLWTDDFASLFQIIRSDVIPQNDPAFTDTECMAAFTLYQQGNFAGAIARFRHALKTLPRSPILLSNLAFLLTTCPDESLRNIPEATRLAEEACQLTHYHTPAFLSTLAVIYSETGRFTEAILMAEKASALATEAGEQALVQKNQELLLLYRAHRPFHESTSPSQTEPPTNNPSSTNVEKLVPAAQ
jgi:tetratricopeptide (TPR) repeat protein